MPRLVFGSFDLGRSGRSPVSSRFTSLSLSESVSLSLSESLSESVSLSLSASVSASASSKGTPCSTAQS